MGASSHDPVGSREDLVGQRADPRQIGPVTRRPEDVELGTERVAEPFPARRVVRGQPHALPRRPG